MFEVERGRDGTEPCVTAVLTVKGSFNDCIGEIPGVGANDNVEGSVTVETTTRPPEVTVVTSVATPPDDGSIESIGEGVGEGTDGPDQTDPDTADDGALERKSEGRDMMPLVRTGGTMLFSHSVVPLTIE